ncbi:phosphate acetyltransferase [Actinomyces dentalis]|uniref:phosphate acetyltransferase n=1 Tax=Actinomyces dentalis TaxID=272548 RepID=UPI0004163554|nr:phosphate acetyltransferase [Actinomyces dentalis]
MARSIYIASPNAGTGKSTVALGLIVCLTKVVAKVGVFRPFVDSRDEDPFLNLLLARSGSATPAAQCIGVTWDEYHAAPEESLSRIVDAYRAVARDHDVVIIDGSDFTDVAGTPELDLNARVAANIGVPVLLVVSGRGAPEDVRASVEVSVAEIAENHARTVAVIANRCPAAARGAVTAALSGIEGLTVTTLPEVPLLSAPSVREIADAVEGTLIAGDAALLEREAEGVLVAAMDVSHVLERLAEGQVVIVPADRSAVIISLAAAHASTGFPNLAGLVLNGGFRVAPHVLKLIRGLEQPLPVITSPLNTFAAASVAGSLRGRLGGASEHKLDVAVTTFEQETDLGALLATLEVEPSDVVTPIMFQAELVEHARAVRKTIVLPESDDDRILRAADAIMRRGIADIVLLGDETTVRARAAELGLNISAARVVSTSDPALSEKYAAEFARLRAKKGVTLEQARERIQDVSYFGTMMVHMGDADGMVSGAAHTTAHTIVPSFQIIKTRPGTSIVSSVFLMLLEDRVLVYGDCAVNPEPTAEQLADIAISSAATARQFGVEPRVAMLSFSTGTSGKGADVDKVRRATELVRAKAPELAVEGPIQYDAAIDPTVAAKKAPESAVAGRANVFIFPDLSSGNIGYKAVQRSSGAVAVGPVLQGLNKPVNDLSRGALVEDIINTVAITAIQAQG